MRRTLGVIYDFATAPFWISLYMRKLLFSFLSVYLHLSTVLSLCPSVICLSVCLSLTFLSRVEEMLAQIAAEDALLENAALLQLAARGPTQDEAPKEGDELPVLAEHGFGRLRRRLRGGGAVPTGEVVGVGQRGGVGVGATAARAQVQPVRHLVPDYLDN
jgi:hypothetical protein